MEATGLDLSGIFGLLQSGSAPDVSRDHLALGISSVVHSRCLAQSQSALSDISGDSICLCLSLTDRIINQRSAGNLPQDVREFYEDVTRKLFGEMDLMRGLISLLRREDQLVSHLSAKCISSYVVHDIISTGDISSLWMQTCYEAFQNVAASSELDSCLWCLTVVMKQVLKGSSRNTEDVLSKLFSGLAGSLTCLYLRLLPGDAKHPPSRTLCVFFDLLEVLNAARFQTGVSSPLQTAIFRESRALIRVTRADVEYLVKKRALLLLKRSFLRRCGEDWALADHHSGPREDPTLIGDMLSMARAVLQEVDSDWLRDVPVMNQASFFGGNCAEGLDHVVLRAVSLIVLKSLDIVIRSVDKSGASLNIQPCLTELLRFLQHHMTPFPSDSHGCCWVSAAFAEQDDDVMEAANTLIGLYLYHCSEGSSEPEVCFWGCNPHCHFVLLLRCLSFDHTVLLDFLISSETCFLEYCVRYLKLLLEDRRGLLASCRRIAPSQTWRTSGLVDAPRLVDYGSSEESEADDEKTVSAACPLFHQVVTCLLDLKKAIVRLHDKRLFPYNPNSLLKLLSRVESSAFT